MDEDQAQRFAMRMIETWPSGPRRQIWRDVAIGLDDPDAARAAYVVLERACPTISVATFRAQYETQTRAQSRLIDTGPTCTLCDGTGMVDAPDRVTTNRRGEERRSSQTEPCTCAVGRERAEMVARLFPWVTA